MARRFLLPQEVEALVKAMSTVTGRLDEVLERGEMDDLSQSRLTDVAGALHRVTDLLGGLTGPQEAPQSFAEEHRARYAAERAVWEGMTEAQRESVLFRVLGDGQLTITEIWAAINRAIPDPGWIPHSRATSIVTRGLKRGWLERVPEEYRSKTRYRYFRKRALEGPIAGLEEAYNNDSEAVA